MKELEINGGQLSLTSTEEITLEDITTLATRAVEAKIPANARVSYVNVNHRQIYTDDHRPAGFVWEVSISWAMPRPNLYVREASE